jgi:hypothetical protein
MRTPFAMAMLMQRISPSPLLPELAEDLLGPEVEADDTTGHASYTTYGLVNTLRASSSRLRLVSWA